MAGKSRSLCGRRLKGKGKGVLGKGVSKSQWKLSPHLWLMGSQQISDHRFWLVPAYNGKRLLPYDIISDSGCVD